LKRQGADRTLSTTRQGPAIVTFGLATLSFFLVEKPAMSLKRSRRGTTPLDVALGADIPNF
jgi:peptidoglycan/LPS O-acetylase OafA/YrhL